MTEHRILSVTAEGMAADAGHKFHTQVGHAATRLVHAMCSWQDIPRDAKVIVTIPTSPIPDLGDEGYTIRNASSSQIEVAGNSDAGAANGIYGLMLAIRTKQIAAPFAETWAVVETPRWADRRVAPACYAMGMTKMTPETWAFPEWKEYIDFVRGLNMNRMTILGLYAYHPDLSSTHQHKWRLDAQKQAIAYAHELGMKVNVMIAFNHVPTEVFWQHPELRTDAVRGYFGLALCWSKAKDVIMKYHRYSFEYLEGLDGIEIMVTEPLGWCLCDQCRPDTAAVWLDAVNELGAALREQNPNAEVVFWNWLSGFFSALVGIYPPTTEIKNLAEIQRQLLDQLPSDVIFTDLSKNQLTKDQEFGPRLSHPDSIEILGTAPANGFEARNFFFYMDKEFGILDRACIFPKPYLDHTIDEIEYSKGLPVNGVTSYRLAPPGRFLSDFFFMRMAWDPEIGRDDLVDQAAAYLTSNVSDRRAIAEAIEKIELYWHQRAREDLIAARDAFERAASDDSCLDLLRIRDGLVILTMVDDYARTVAELDEATDAGEDVSELTQARQEKLLAVYTQLKEYPIYQGLTTDGMWEPRSVIMLLRPHIDLWANYINHKGYYE